MIEGPVDAREGNFEHSFPGLAIHVEPPMPGLQLMATHQLTDYDVGICQRVSAVGQVHSRSLLDADGGPDRTPIDMLEDVRAGKVDVAETIRV